MTAKYDSGSGILFDYIHSVEILDSTLRDANYFPTMSTAREETLLSLLLFDKAEILSSAAVGREVAAAQLRSDGLIEYTPNQFFHNSMSFIDSYTGNLETNSWLSREGRDDSDLETTIKAQEKSILAYYPLISTNRKTLTDVDFHVASLHTYFHYGDFSSTHFFVDKDYCYYDLDKHGPPINAEFLVDAHSMERHHKIFGESIDDLKRQNDIAADMLSGYIEYRGLTERAKSSGKPIKARCSAVKNAVIDKTLGPEAMQLFRVHLDEVRVMPYLGSIEDVYRLRGHQKINNFRSAIFEWLERVASGEKDVEQKYRAQLRIAADDLKKLDKWRPLNSPYTLIASIAVGIVEMFTGTPFGLLMSAASGVALLDKWKREKAYGYAIFPK